MRQVAAAKAKAKAKARETIASLYNQGTVFFVRPRDRSATDEQCPQSTSMGSSSQPHIFD